MTNEQIIKEIAVQVYGEEKVMKMLEAGMEIPLHTVQGWNMRGPYKIKKGEHGLETKLWRKRKRKADEKNSKKNEDSDAETADNNKDFYLCKAFLFRADQVEKVDKEQTR